MRPASAEHMVIVKYNFTLPSYSKNSNQIVSSSLTFAVATEELPHNSISQQPGFLYFKSVCLWPSLKKQPQERILHVTVERR